jgi:AraC-like DNA-binding protein
VQLPSDSNTIQAFDEILKMSKTRSFKDGYDNSAAAFHFLMKLKQEIAITTGDETHFAAKQCLNFIDQNLHLPIGLEDLIRVSQLSKSHFYDMFEATTGETPQRFLIKTRIFRAMQLLTDTRFTVEQVAKHCGFANGNYMAKVFRKNIGITPLEVRNKPH